MIKTIQNYLKACMKYNKTKKELYRLTDRELMDIGIYRYDIERLAQETFDTQMKNNNNSSIKIEWSRA